MSEAKDTLLRQLTLLRLIPEYPRYTSSQTLNEKLQDRGYKVELRTVQRDLNRLSAPFSLTNSKKGGRNEWSYTKGTPLDLRDMEPSTALALYLAESHLSMLLPQSVLDLLGPQFNRARNYLDNLGQNDLAHWARRVRTHPNGKIAWLLGETPLSPKQSLEPLPNSDWQRLRAVVPDDQETLWWVFGLGENVRVWEPQGWCKAISDKANKLGALYAHKLS